MMGLIVRNRKCALTPGTLTLDTFEPALFMYRVLQKLPSRSFTLTPLSSQLIMFAFRRSLYSRNNLHHGYRSGDVITVGIRAAHLLQGLGIQLLHLLVPLQISPHPGSPRILILEDSADRAFLVITHIKVDERLDGSTEVNLQERRPACALA